MDNQSEKQVVEISGNLFDRFRSEGLVHDSSVTIKGEDCRVIGPKPSSDGRYCDAVLVEVSNATRDWLKRERKIK